MSRALRVQLVVIDPQVDFCSPAGALYVKGAEKDMQRLAAMIGRLGERLEFIHCTLDLHHQLHIAHPLFWKDTAGNPPATDISKAPPVVITAQQVKDGIWTPPLPQLRPCAIKYLEALEKGGQCLNMIWPPHCLIGSAGATIYPCVYDALMEWERNTGRVVDKIMKGCNVMTEHFSAFQAKVPDLDDPSTQLNTYLFEVICEADLILFAGESRAHVASSCRDLANGSKDDNVIQKIGLLDDATSNITGCEFMSDALVKELTGRGIKIIKTTDILA